MEDQRNRVERLKVQGQDAGNAERLLSLFSRSLAILEDNLKSAQAGQKAGS